MTIVICVFIGETGGRGGKHGSRVVLLNLESGFGCGGTLSLSGDWLHPTRMNYPLFIIYSKILFNKSNLFSFTCILILSYIY